MAVEVVGRATERAVLTDALADARAGRGSLVVVTGHAGIGKSVLVSQFAAEAAAGQSWVALGRCLEGAGRPAFQPWLQIQEALVTHGLLARERLPIPERADSYRGALLDHVTEALLGTAVSGDVVLLVEDLHLANPETVLLLRHLAERLADSTLLVVATIRPVEANLRLDIRETVAELLVAGSELSVEPFGREEVAEVLSDAGLRADDAEEVLRRTAGNPLFVQTAVRLLRSGAGLDTADIPASIRQAVHRQVSLASGIDTRIEGFLQAASVVGQEFGLALLHHVYPEDVDHLVDIAVGLGVLTEVPGAVARFAFAHALVRESIYTSLSPGLRGRLHAQVLTAGEMLDVDDAAYHAVRAAASGKARDAVALSMLAADRATALYAFEAAAEHVRNALEALDLVVPFDPRKRCDLLTRLAELTGQAGDPAAARAHGLLAVTVAERAGDMRRRARAALAAASQVHYLQRDVAVVDLLTSCLDSLGPAPTIDRARLLARRAELMVGGVNFDVLDADTAEAVAIASRSADRDLRFDMLAARLVSVWGSPSHEGRVQDATELMATATSDDRRMRAQLWVLHHRLVDGDIAAGRAALAEIERIAERTGWGRHRLFAASRRAMVLTLEGDLDAAEDAVERAHALGVEAHDPEADAVRWGQLFALGWHRELSPEQLDFVTTLAAQYLKTPVWRLFSAALAVLAVWSGDFERARRLTADAFAGGVGELPRDQHLIWLLSLLAWLGHALEDDDLAREVDGVLELFDGQAPMAGCAVQWMGLVRHYRGLAALTYRDHELGVRRLAEACDAYEQMGASPWFVDAAGALARVPGQRPEHAEMVSRAEAAAARIGVRTGALPVSSSPRLVREGETWRLVSPHGEVRLKSTLGLTYLDQLLRNPGREISAVALAGVAGTATENEILDDRARSAYRVRIEQLDAALADADARGDVEGSERAENERSALLAQLRRASGLGGRPRILGSTAEKARLNVTRAIRSALDRITAHNAALGSELSRCVRTGTWCCYEPASGKSIQGDQAGQQPADRPYPDPPPASA